MANAFYNRGANFNPDELADGDAIEAEFDAVARGFDTIGTNVDANKAGYPTQTFHVAPATEATHAARKEQLDTHINDQGAVHGATPSNVAGKLLQRDANGDVAARKFLGSLTGNADSASKVSAIAPDAGSAVLIDAAMSGNDAFRLLVAGAADTDTGFVEFATGDNGNEPIVFRQYAGAFTSIVKSLFLLDESGNTRLPGQLYLGGDQWLEYGSNANGIYARFANGLLICLMGTKTITIGTNSIAAYDFYMPSASVGSLYPFATTHEVWNGGVNGTIKVMDTVASDDRSIVRAIVSSMYWSPLPITVHMAAIGTWK